MWTKAGTVLGTFFAMAVAGYLTWSGLVAKAASVQFKGKEVETIATVISNRWSYIENPYAIGYLFVPQIGSQNGTAVQGTQDLNPEDCVVMRSGAWQKLNCGKLVVGDQIKITYVSDMPQTSVVHLGRLRAFAHGRLIEAGLILIIPLWSALMRFFKRRKRSIGT